MAKCASFPLLRPILTKPISRFEYMAGKYLGLVAKLGVMMVAMLALFWVACFGTATEFMMISAGEPDMAKTQALKVDVAERSAPLLERGVLAKLRRIFFRS